MARYRFAQATAAATGAVLTLISTQVSAGFAGTVTYGPAAGAAAVPAVGGYALIALALLVGLAVFRLRKEPVMQGNRFLGFALMVTVVATGASGVKVVQAIAEAPAVPLDNPQGGSAPLVFGTSCLRNETDVNLAITEITPFGSFTIVDSRDGFCTEEPIDNGGANAGEAPDCGTSPPTELAPNKACAITIGEAG